MRAELRFGVLVAALLLPGAARADDFDPTASMCFSLISSWYARCSRESTVWRSDGTVAHTSLSSDASVASTLTQKLFWKSPSR